MRRQMCLVLAGLLIWGESSWCGENWPQFRGEKARGISDGTGLPDRWSASENVGSALMLTVVAV